MSNRHSQGLSERDTIEALAVVWAVVNGYQKGQAATFLRANGFAVDAPKASDLFKLACDRGWVYYDSIFQRVPDELRPTDPSVEILERARKAASDHSGLEDLLRKECPRIFRHVHISFSSHEGTSKAQWDERLAYFARFASKAIPPMLRKAKFVGVGWGHTVAALVSALNTPAVRKNVKRDILFVPTCGEPLKPAGSEHWPERASTSLAGVLSDLFSSTARRLSLSGVVAVEPECFRSPEGRGFLRQYFDAISDYADIFGSASHAGTPLISQLDTILTSVGSFGQSWRMYTSELDRAGGISADELAALFVGDQGGAVIPMTGLNKKQQRTCQEVVDSWTGISLAQYGRIARNAAKSGANGVVVIAIGANKLEVVLEVVRRGLVNQLIIDHDLANALLLRLR